MSKDKKITKYAVGQVLFVLSSERAKVYPIQIIEEVIHKRLDGEDVTYMFAVAEEMHNKKKFELARLKGELFMSHSDAEKIMLSRAEIMIKSLVSKAVEQAGVFNGQPDKLKKPDIEKPDIEKSDIEKPISTLEQHQAPVIKLPDGRMARVNIKS